MEPAQISDTAIFLYFCLEVYHTPMHIGPVFLTLFNKSIWNIDCWLIDTSEKYGYQYQYEKVENIDIEKENLENIGIDIEQG